MNRIILNLFILSTLFLSTGYAQEPEAMTDEAWQVLREFFSYDKNIPLDAEVTATEAFEWCTRYRIEFTGIRNQRVPAYLAVPNDTAPFPVVLGCHGGYGSKDHFWNVIDKHGFLQPMLSAGYAVFILDAVYHGERQVDNEHYTIGRILADQSKYTFSDLLFHTAADYRRALDYLETRGDMDMNRIGIFGHSMGGILTFLITGVEERVKVAVPCVGPPTYPVISYPTYLIHYAVRFKDQPTLMLMGKSDPTYTVESAEYLFAHINSKIKNIVWFESGHNLPPQWSSEAVKWFQNHLN